MSDLKGKTCQFAQPWEPGCGKPAKTEHEGKLYCGIHNPVKRAARQKVRLEKGDAERKASRLRQTQRQARKEAGEEALAMMSVLVVNDYTSRSMDLFRHVAPGILAKAEGKS